MLIKGVARLDLNILEFEHRGQPIRLIPSLPDAAGEPVAAASRWMQAVNLNFSARGSLGAVSRPS